MITTDEKGDYTFDITILQTDGTTKYEMTVFRDGVLDQDPRLFDTIAELVRWVGFVLEWADANR